MNSGALRMAGMALRAGRLAVGDEAAGDACQEKKCRLLLLASDAGESAKRRGDVFAETGQCLLAELSCTKEELGAALGRKSCAMAAVTDLGLARAIAGHLAEDEPERYSELTERLRVKAERAARRKEKKTGDTKRKPDKYKRKKRES